MATESTVITLVQRATQLRKAGHLQAAFQAYQAAIALNDAMPELWFNYGNLLQQLEQQVQAEQAFRKAIALKEDFFQAHLNLANLLRDRANTDPSARHLIEPAITHYHRVIQLKPDFPLAYNNLGRVLVAQQHLKAAADVYAAWLRIDPKNPVALNGLGVALQAQGQHEAALSLFQQSLVLDPDRFDTLNNLGAVLRILRRPHEAIPYLRQAIVKDPSSDTAINNLVHALLNLGQVGEALTQTEQVLQRYPNSASAHLMRGFALSQWAQTQAAMNSFQRTWELDNTAKIAISNALFTLLYRDEMSEQAFVEERQRWVARLPQPVMRYQAWLGSREPERRLKIGYLSGDLRSHPVAFFLEPILAHHDIEQVDISCYDVAGVEDAVTARLKTYANHWQNCVGWSDQALAQRIHSDAIDILVDLSGHTAGNRAGVLMHKPAPLQMLYIGYPGSTGLPEVDYLISDKTVSPPDFDGLYVEQVLRVTGSFWCFQPNPLAPGPNPLPALENGYITLGSFNHTPKLSKTTIQLWSQVLTAMPNARLKLKAQALGDEATCDYFRHQFNQQGADLDRIILEGPTLQLEKFFQSYHSIDIALDPTPYNGGTTTCEALWMGVPVVTLPGKRFCSRMSHSLLNHVGLPELSAKTEADYVRIAIALATDLDKLAEIRRTLRERLAASPVCDAQRAAQQIEQTYRTVWRKFCSSIAVSGN